MAQKPSERPFWFLPLVGFLIPVGVGGIFLVFQALQWSGGEKKSIVEQKYEKPLKNEPSNEQEASPPVYSPATPPAAPITAPPVSEESGSKRLPDSEMSLYASEIDSLNQMAEVRRQSATEMRQAGGLQEAIALLKQASQMYEVVSCLINQRKLGVFFYQGKATCTAAIPTS